MTRFRLNEWYFMVGSETMLWSAPDYGVYEGEVSLEEAAELARAILKMVETPKSERPDDRAERECWWASV